MKTTGPETYRIGDARITRVSETLLTTLTARDLYADWDESRLDAYARWLLLGRPEERRDHVVLSVHSWLVQIDGQTILIDTGIGNGKDRPFSKLFDHLQTRFLEQLEALGVTPENVDHVLLTHLHVDHVGWNTRLVDGRWVPTFPNATYVFPQREQAFYSTPAGASRRMVFDDSVLPVVEANQALTIDERGGNYLRAFTFHPTPGHSVGHMSISLKSAGAAAIFAGDVMHNPVQVYRPEWASVFCADPERARQSRLWLLAQAADHESPVFSSHFPETSAGRIIRSGDGFEWTYI
ncbi:MAG: MBL fold metallo-hydrolase [Beijerinckiaceae bacterium]|nr:MBL fold metallo-hydrolase [Beijerinckiaceae bacterium]